MNQTCPLSNYIRDCFNQYQNEIFLISGSTTYKYIDVMNSILQKSDFFIKSGIRAGDILTISYKRNSLDFIYSILSTLFIGAKCCLIPPAHQQAHNDDNILGQWFISDVPPVSFQYPVCASYDQYTLYHVNEIRTLPDELDEAWLILPTSGTTGRSKWIFLSNEGIMKTVSSIKVYMNTGPEDIFFALKHLGHISSVTSDLLLSLFSGGKLVVNISDFNVRNIAAQIKNNGVTVLTLVPTILKYLLNDHCCENMNKLRAVSLVGAPAHHSLLLEANNKLPHVKLYIGYGLTEASSRVTYLPPDKLVEKMGSIGKPIEGTTVKLLQDGEEIKTLRTIGEIVVKGPGVMLGYLNGMDLVIHRDEFLFTNDLAFYDEDGFYYHYGRKDDVMIINGVNISPVQVEEKIILLEVVQTCVVFKDTASQDYDKMIALIELKQGIIMNESEVYLKMQEVLPLTLMPKKIKIVEKIPVESNGKISKKKISKQYYGDLRKETMKASIIVPVYNQAEQLNIMLEAFKHQIIGDNESYEIIIVDDGSQNPIPPLEKKFNTLDITLITQPNKGRAAARNTGVSYSSGELLIFCDCDRFPGRKFVTNHMQTHRREDNFVAIGKIGEIFTKNLEEVLWNVQLDADMYTKQMRVPFYPRIITKIYDESGFTESELPWMGTFSGNMSVYKDLFLSVGGYDENFTSWGLEHFDLGYRLQKNGACFLYNQTVNYHIAHTRDISRLQQNIVESVAYMEQKYSDQIMDKFKSFMSGDCSLQSIEQNKNASWLEREKLPLVFKVGNI